MDSNNQRLSVYGLPQDYNYGASSASWSQLSAMEQKTPVNGTNNGNESPICKPPPYHSGIAVSSCSMAVFHIIY